ncbi:MAG: AarF/ABC1/UbiB kinase family protein [Myxococcales bacterium]|nr:AarF/ABC1/UbiB kinase family protein [Myxococcales bacterium]
MQKQNDLPTQLPHDMGSPRQLQPRKERRHAGWLYVLRFFLGTLWILIKAEVFPSLAGSRLSADARVERYVRFFVRMGGAWIKAGQILAMRRDLLSDSMCAAFAHLRDQTVPMSGALARQILQAELGPQAEDIVDFDEQPLASAALGQLHRARLRSSGVEVAIKIQHPDVAEHIRHDLRLIKFLVFLIRRFALLAHVPWDDMLWELEKSLNESLDYRVEAVNTRRMRRLLRKQKIYAPKVFLDHSTQRVMVMELVHGVFLSEVASLQQHHPDLCQTWQAENGMRPLRMARHLFDSCMRQMLEHNLFHCELRPDNILLQRKGRFVLIDFGTVGTCDQNTLDRLRLLHRALVEEDFAKAVDLYLLSAPVLPNGDVASIKAEMVRALRAWSTRAVIKSLPVADKSLARILAELMAIGGAHEVHPSWDMLRVYRSLVAMDESFEVLAPHTNHVRLSLRYQQKAQNRALKESASPAAMRQQLFQLRNAMRLPAMLAENAYFDGEWLRKRAMTFEADISKAAFVGKVLFGWLAQATLVFGLFVGANLLYQQIVGMRATRSDLLHRVLSVVPLYSWEIWAVVLLGSISLFRTFVDIRRRFERKDPGNTVSGQR